MLLTAACATPERVTEVVSKPAPAVMPAPLPTPVPTPPPAVPSAAEQRANQQVQAAQNLYDQGDYAKAVDLLYRTNEIWEGTDPRLQQIQIRALKLMAFSYCLTNRQERCRRQFDLILERNPAFDLEPGERDHPLWGKAFAQSKKAARGAGGK